MIGNTYIEIQTMKLAFKHFIILNVIDVLLTWYAITFLGMREGNPILYQIFQQIGLITGLVVIKLLGLMIIYGLISKTPLKLKFGGFDMNPQKTGTTTICLLMVFVVANNIYQIASFIQ